MVLSPSLSQCLLFKFSFSCHEKRYIKWNTRREIIHLEASCLRLNYFLCGVCVWVDFCSILLRIVVVMLCFFFFFYRIFKFYSFYYYLLQIVLFFCVLFCRLVVCIYSIFSPFFPFWERQRQTNHFRNLKKERNSIKEPDSLHCYIDRWTSSTKELNRKTHLIFSFF